ncbi:MAG: bifunctional DNA primase/polymerase [Comamonadaceae bacterium]|jgi:hypothetical protein|uniref:bifunctional DNA primase/polymerase n=1 Tax=Candidatus Skiveiella danica TaxID=3386177 RepID=UPI0009D1511E|nr:bifunctional DNA primase/polymerase [Comamonadaceae bacterium]MBK9198040.1 bifunctional DNA primase/polymerase [Betaproteobacteria bacterium]OQC13741.1 MAG: hypothetical protein BWX73_02183 [Lentisphaerae bacterium ADurb.Bin082]MBK6559734.1 bifunctional DNA primase/polymerase [Comamonadaceae bacterium]MBK7120095.1 bifunctional DNA primase/polymerase [Comamonadaceae bacterium]
MSFCIYGRSDQNKPNPPLKSTFLPSFKGFDRYHQAASFWFERRFRVIPVIPGTKQPAVKWDDWLARLSRSSIHTYWSSHPDHEVGFIVGDEYIVFDADSPKAVDALMDAEISFGLTPSLIVQTTRGEHHYFRKDPSVKGKTAYKIVGAPEDRIDIKTGRTMVILPPSTGKFIVKLAAENAGEICQAPQTFIEFFARGFGISDRFTGPEVTASTARRPDAEGLLKPPSDQTLRLLQSALNLLDPDMPYPDWFRAAAAIFNNTGGAESGFTLFDDWSREGKKYKGRHETRAIWKSLRLDYSWPVTLGTP